MPHPTLSQLLLGLIRREEDYWRDHGPRFIGRQFVLEETVIYVPREAFHIDLTFDMTLIDELARAQLQSTLSYHV